MSIEAAKAKLEEARVKHASEAWDLRMEAVVLAIEAQIAHTPALPRPEWSEPCFCCGVRVDLAASPDF